MDKLAVVTLNTSPEWEKLAEVTAPSQRAYAQRMGADFIVIKRREFAHPHYDKWQLAALFDEYDRILYVDADVIVRPDCPDLFVTVPPECVGGEDELPGSPLMAGHLMRFAQRLGVGPMPCPYYLNAGLFVASSTHRELFRPPEAVPDDLPWPEQSHFNLRLIQSRVRVCLLPSAFNNRYPRVEDLRSSFIFHYAATSMEVRLDSARRDLAAWRRLFRQGG